jgi:cell wall-associated NlpC family hydrolase
MSLQWDNLIGLRFLLGRQDCFQLGRTFYKQNFDIEIANYARPQNWDPEKLDLIGACFDREGFEKITHWRAEDLRPGDALCMSVGSSAPNHFSIYVGDNTMVHHLAGRLSGDEPYRDFWRSYTSYILRHPSVPDLRPVYPDKDIGEILRERLDFAAQSR